MDSTDPLAGSLADVIASGTEAELPVPTDAEPMASRSIRLPVDLLDWAKDEAQRRGLPSWSALVRELLEWERDPVKDDAVIPVRDLRRVIDQLAHQTSAA